MSLTDRIWSLFGGARGGAPDCAACEACATVAHGSVTPHDVHILIRLDPPASGRPAWEAWSERVDDHPAIAAVAAAVAAHREALRGSVKITAFEYPAAADAPPQAPGTHDVLVFPANVKLPGIPLAALGDRVVAALSAVRTSNPTPGAHEELMKGMVLLVCCHAARDARCGYLGPRLADALTEQGAQVVLSSHVGGHQYAGNVIAYGARQPSAGTWFGGLSAEAAPEFLAALRALPLSGDPAEDRVLRRWWRGRVGLTKEEQAKHYRRCGQRLGDIEDAGDAA